MHRRECGLHVLTVRNGGLISASLALSTDECQHTLHEAHAGRSAASVIRSEVKLDGEDLLIMKESDIMGILG